MKRIVLPDGRIITILEKEIVCPKCKGEALFVCICNGTGKMILKEELLSNK